MFAGEEESQLTQLLADLSRLQTELAESRETNRRLNRRCQAMESADSAEIRHMNGAVKEMYGFLERMRDNYANGKYAVRCLRRRYREMTEDEWVLARKLLKTEQECEKRIQEEVKRRLAAEGDFLAAKAYCEELEGIIMDLNHQDAVADTNWKG